MTADEKQWIDNASYQELLRRWRFAPSSDPIIQDKTGAYFQTVLHRRRAELGVDEHVRISKLVGWEK
jgi:hypothetical protein